jgi:xanthine dehydrogenase accessory factor
MVETFFDQLASASVRDEAFALGLITSVKGSSPQKAGAKALFFQDGRIVGTLGGGCLEAEVRERARRALLDRRAESFELVLDNDFGWDDGLICGGKVSGLILPHAREFGELWRALARRDRVMSWEIRHDFSAGITTGASHGWKYRETVAPPCSLWIAGAGHIARALAPLALKLDFDVTVFDDRATLASHAQFPAETRLRVGFWEELLSDPLPEFPCLGLILTRGHQHDALVLRQWIQRPFVFLGMIGSERKRRLIFSRFLEENLATETQLNAVECPVGLSIGAVSVDEIALSIAGRLVERRAALPPPWGSCLKTGFQPS